MTPGDRPRCQLLLHTLFSEIGLLSLVKDGGAGGDDHAADIAPDPVAIIEFPPAAAPTPMPSTRLGDSGSIGMSARGLPRQPARPAHTTLTAVQES
ncbi:MAG: hypothetical protein ACRD3F_13450 [Acidobacteriaceae bacterium]